MPGSPASFLASDSRVAQEQPKSRIFYDFLRHFQDFPRISQENIQENLRFFQEISQNFLRQFLDISTNFSDLFRKFLEILNFELHYQHFGEFPKNFQEFPRISGFSMIPMIPSSDPKTGSLESLKILKTLEILGTSGVHSKYQREPDNSRNIRNPFVEHPKFIGKSLEIRKHVFERWRRMHPKTRRDRGQVCGPRGQLSREIRGLPQD